MFGPLIESRRRRQRSTGGMMASILAHAAVIGVAVQVTAGRAGVPPAGPVAVVPIPFLPPPAAPPRHSAGGRSSSGGGFAARGPLPAQPGFRVDVQVPGFPVSAPPAVDLGDVRGGLGTGPGGASGGGSAGSGAPGVDAQALPLPGNPEPVYPSVLRLAGMEGRVLAQFVVDTAGRVEPESIRLAAMGSDLFAAAVRRALRRARFIPGRAAGRPVRVLMEREFVFRIAVR